MGDDNARDLPILIIGAGACGLALANGLKQNNIPAVTFDREPGLDSRARTRDWAVACHWSAPTLAALLGPAKWSRAQACLVDPHQAAESMAPVRVFDGRTGEPVARVASSGTIHRFLRSRLRALMAEGIEVRYGKRLERVEYERDSGAAAAAAAAAAVVVVAHFEDGSSARGRLLVSCDGARSRTRALLLGDGGAAALRRLPVAATFVHARFTAEQARFLRGPRWSPIGNMFVHPDDGGRIALFALRDARDRDRPETWSFTFYIGVRCSVEDQDAMEGAMTLRDRVRQAKEMAKVWSEPIRQAYEWVSDDVESAYHVNLCNWDPSLPEHQWEKNGGLVTLAGDAAHPMTYHRGQGLNQAIADAGQLVELLKNQGQTPQADIIDSYEKEMRERGGEEVRLSEMNTMMVHDWEQVMNSPLVKQGLKTRD